MQEKKDGEGRITKWVLVTPTDFVNPAQRKGGGDVAWFEGLRESRQLPFAIEHCSWKRPRSGSTTTLSSSTTASAG